MILEGVRKRVPTFDSAFFSLTQCVCACVCVCVRACVCVSASLRPHLYRAAADRMLLGIKRLSHTQSASPPPTTTHPHLHLSTSSHFSRLFSLYLPLSLFHLIAGASSLICLHLCVFQSHNPHIVAQHGTFALMSESTGPTCRVGMAWVYMYKVGISYFTCDLAL